MQLSEQRFVRASATVASSYPWRSTQEAHRKSFSTLKGRGFPQVWCHKAQGQLSKCEPTVPPHPQQAAVEHTSNVKVTEQSHSKASDGEDTELRNSVCYHPHQPPGTCDRHLRFGFFLEAKVIQISYLRIKPRTFGSATQQHPNHAPQWQHLKENLWATHKGK